MDDTSARNTSKNNKNVFYAILIAIVVIGIVVTIIKLSHNNQNTPLSTNQLEKPKATTQLNKTYTFSIKDANGINVGSLSYNLENAELRDQILIKGQKAESVTGKTFLIINLKITNKTDKNITVNSRDYIRLSVTDGQEWLAPDIHNDPVEVDAASTKYTRLGFAITNTQANKSIIQVGEIKGNKDKIKLHFNTSF